MLDPADPGEAVGPDGRQVLAAVRLVSYLNAVRHGRVSVEVAARSVVGEDVAHHVVDSGGLLGLDPLRANELHDALATLGLFVDSDWLLCLPRPGAPAGLSGDALAHAMDAAVAVAPVRGGLVFVPHVVGAAVQWLVVPGGRVGPAPQAYDAERALSEAVISAGRQLAELDLDPVLGGRRSRQRTTTSGIHLAPGYPGRNRATAEKAWLLYHACATALEDEAGQLSSFAVESRFTVLRTIRDRAADALTAACVWQDEVG